jgi:8-oxo-dGTP pyrophosphatase MutT (NUDIX family)
MAFPGGRVDPGDISREAAAVREVAEEGGIDLPACGRLLGRLEQVASPPMRRRVVMTPYVWVLSGDVPLQPDATEVASTHWFSLERFLSGEGRGTFEYRFRGSIVPLSRVDLEGHRVWGMTLRVVDDLLARIRALR